MPCRAYWQSGNRHQGIQQSSNPAILLHDIPHLAINRCCLLICNSDFNFNKFLHQKICQRGFINFIGIQLVPERVWVRVGFGWVWVLGGLNRKQSTCLVSIAHSNVCICMWLPVCCSALLTSLCKPFICPIIQPEAILFDTHIPQAPRTFRPLYTVCSLSAQSGVTQTRTLS